jgi:RNA polymerase sigma factor (sigma-70 family)
MATSPASQVIQHVRRALLNDEGGLTDGQLLGYFIERHDEAAFAALVERHGALVWNVCRRLLGQEDAEDAFQATFLVLCRKAGSIRHREMVASWLYGVAHQTALQARRAATRRRAREKQVMEMPEAAVAKRDIWSDLQPLLDQELSRLPDTYQVVILLCDLGGKSRKEVARHLNLPEGTVASRLARARAVLAKRLARRGLAVPGGALAAVLSENALSAGVPTSVVSATIKAGTSIVAGTAVTTGTIPSTVAGLTEGVLKAMLLRKLKMAPMVFAFLTALAAGAGGPLCPAESVREDGTIARTAESADGPKKEMVELPPGAIARLGTVCFRQPGGMVSAIALTDNGKVLATGGDGGTVCLWDASTGAPLRRLKRPWSWTEVFVRSPVWITSLGFSPNGQKVLASGANGFACLWDADTGRTLRMLWRHRGVVRASAFSPDGTTVATGCDDRTVRLWQAATGKELRRFEGQREHDVWSVAFAPDGKTLATGGNCGELFLYDVATGREIHRCRGHRSVANSVRFCPDGKTFVSGSHDGTVRQWDTVTGRELRRVAVPGEVWAVALSANGRSLAALTREYCVHVLDLATLRETARFKVKRSVQGSLMFARDGRCLIGGDGCSISRWDVTTGKQLLPEQGHRAVVAGLAFAPDGKTLVSGGWDGIVYLWDPATGAVVRRLEGHDEAVHAVAVAPQGRVLASVSRHGCILWDQPSGRPLHRLQGSSEASRLALSFAPDGKTLASQGKDGLVHLWDVATGRDLGPLRGRQDLVLGLDFSPDGSLLATGGVVHRPVPKGSNDRCITLWSVATRREVRQLEGHKEMVAPVVFSPRGTVLASGACDGTVRVWETAAGGERCRFSLSSDETPAVAFSADGRLLAIGRQDGTIRVRDLDTGEPWGLVRSPQGYIQSLAFSPDGRLLASGGTDSTILLWDVARIFRPRQATGVELFRADIEGLWTDLASAEAARGYRAMCRLASDRRQAVALVKQRVRQVAAPDRRRLAQLIRDLDHERISTREQASTELAGLGESAVAALKEALDRKVTAEAAQRIRRLLKGQEQDNLTPEKLRLLRCVEVLEMVATVEARRVLATLADGAAGARLTREARAALNRLGRRAASKP